jgi:hypothetical protein
MSPTEYSIAATRERLEDAPWWLAVRRLRRPGSHSGGIVYAGHLLDCVDPYEAES